MKYFEGGEQRFVCEAQVAPSSHVITCPPQAGQAAIKVSTKMELLPVKLNLFLRHNILLSST
jgi:hypothetical protein